MGSLEEDAFVNMSKTTRSELKPEALGKLLALIACVLEENLEQVKDHCTIVAWTPEGANASLARHLKNSKQRQGDKGVAPKTDDEKDEEPYKGTRHFVIVSPGEAYRSRKLLDWAEKMAMGCRSGEEVEDVVNARKIFRHKDIKIEALDEKYVSLSLQSGIQTWARHLWNSIWSRLAPNKSTEYQPLDDDTLSV